MIDPFRTGYSPSCDAVSHTQNISPARRSYLLDNVGARILGIRYIVSNIISFPSDYTDRGKTPFEEKRIDNIQYMAPRDSAFYAAERSKSRNR